MRTRYQHLRSTTALARPAAGSGLPGQIWINMADEVLGWFNDAGAPVALPFVKPPALAAYLPLAGGTMTGALVLSGAPTQALNPATKAYADAIDTAVRAAFAAADTQVRNDFTAADAALRAEFRAADAALGNDINALATATSNALVTKLALAGGTMTGPLVLAGAPTQPLQAATKKYVDDQIAAIPAPVIPPGTIISDTAPASPKVGQLWFKTVDPVGLYIWYQDTDSAQWVQIGGGSEPPATPDFATPEEAIAGVRQDAIMSPALVRALSGRQQLILTGQGLAPFNQIPDEATEIDLIINGLGAPANTAVRLDFEGAPNARAFSTRMGAPNAVLPTVVGDDNNAFYVLDFHNAVLGLAGMLRLVREGPGQAWGVSGSLRRSTGFLTTYGGVFGMNGDLSARLRLSCTAAMTGGAATARWRI